jgi:hypothetical protein
LADLISAKLEPERFEQMADSDLIQHLQPILKSLRGLRKGLHDGISIKLSSMWVKLALQGAGMAKKGKRDAPEAPSASALYGNYAKPKSKVCRACRHSFFL